MRDILVLMKVGLVVTGEDIVTERRDEDLFTERTVAQRPENSVLLRHWQRPNAERIGVSTARHAKSVS